MKELEERMRRNEKELERVRRENEKLRDVLGRYRERWEKLKEGAKTRRAEGRAAAGPSSTSDTVKNSDKSGATPNPDPSTQEQAESAKSKSDGDTENESVGPETKADSSDS
jgi:phage shock protein A